MAAGKKTIQSVVITPPWPWSFMPGCVSHPRKRIKCNLHTNLPYTRMYDSCAWWEHRWYIKRPESRRMPHYSWKYIAAGGHARMYEIMYIRRTYIGSSVANDCGMKKSMPPLVSSRCYHLVLLAFFRLLSKFIACNAYREDAMHQINVCE